VVPYTHGGSLLFGDHTRYGPSPLGYQASNDTVGHFPVTGLRFDSLSTSTCWLPRIWEKKVEGLALCVCEARTRHHRVDDTVLRPAHDVALLVSSILFSGDSTMPIRIVGVVACFGILGIFLMLREYR